MKKEELKAAAELIGIAAIVASLVFVGLQMKQSQDIAIAEQYQARSTAASEYVLWLAGNESILNRQVHEIKSRYEKREGGDDFIDAYEAACQEHDELDFADFLPDPSLVGDRPDKISDCHRRRRRNRREQLSRPHPYTPAKRRFRERI